MGGWRRDDIDVTPLFPAAGTVDNTHVGTANFGGSAFQYTIPDGFFPAC